MLTELSVYDNVLLALQSARELRWRCCASLAPRRLDDEVMQALERFRLADRADDLAGELSHGEQQWLEIAMALAPRPQAAAARRADRRHEPGGAPGDRRAAACRSRRDCALVIVEHDLDFIKNICDRLTVLDQGKVLGDGTVRRDRARSAAVQEIYTSRV